jgi:hypothetical protein
VLTRAIGMFVAIGLFASTSSATAELLKVSVPQRGQWDTAVTELTDSILRSFTPRVAPNRTRRSSQVAWMSPAAAGSNR